jgi:hypothetical protein
MAPDVDCGTLQNNTPTLSAALDLRNRQYIICYVSSTRGISRNVTCLHGETGLAHVKFTDKGIRYLKHKVLKRISLTQQFINSIHINIGIGLHVSTLIESSSSLPRYSSK